MSIGSIARLKGVTPKAMRYYEKLGILEPAYIDPETGYRYYSASQIVELDVITVALDIRMPLKDLARFKREGGAFDLKGLLLEADKMARSNLKQAIGSLATIEAYLSELDVLGGREESAPPGFAERSMEKTCALTARFPLGEDGRVDLRTYHALMTKLNKAASSNGLVALPFQGLLSMPSKEGLFAMLAYKDVSGTVQNILRRIGSTKERQPMMGSLAISLPGHIEAIALPEMTFSSMNVFGPDLGTAFSESLASDRFASARSENRTVIAIDVWGSQVKSNEGVVELLVEKPA